LLDATKSSFIDDSVYKRLNNITNAHEFAKPLITVGFTGFASAFGSIQILSGTPPEASGPIYSTLSALFALSAVGPYIPEGSSIKTRPNLYAEAVENIDIENYLNND